MDLNANQKKKLARLKQAEDVAKKFFETDKPTMEMIEGIYMRVFLAFEERKKTDLSDGQLEVLDELEQSRDLARTEFEIETPTPKDIFAMYDFVVEEEDEGDE